MKTPKAYGALRQAPDPMPRYARFARPTALHYVGKIGRTRAGAPPLTKSWIRYCLLSAGYGCWNIFSHLENYAAYFSYVHWIFFPCIIATQLPFKIKYKIRMPARGFMYGSVRSSRSTSKWMTELTYEGGSLDLGPRVYKDEYGGEPGTSNRDDWIDRFDGENISSKIFSLLSNLLYFIKQVITWKDFLPSKKQ